MGSQTTASRVVLNGGIILYCIWSSPHGWDQKQKQPSTNTYVGSNLQQTEMSEVTFIKHMLEATFNKQRCRKQPSTNVRSNLLQTDVRRPSTNTDVSHERKPMSKSIEDFDQCLLNIGTQLKSGSLNFWTMERFICA